MIIKSAEFTMSNTDIDQCPHDGLPEYAFIGRSNVGKSSLINMLTGKKGLAMTSSKPGKTQLVNHFLINKEWYLVDLPGYGYAQRGKEGKKNIQKIISDYISKREEMTDLFILIDSRLDPQKIDLDFIRYAGEQEIPFSLIFTKTDKISKNKLSLNTNKFKNTLLQTWESLPPLFFTSSEKNTGKDEILDYIYKINKTLK